MTCKYILFFFLSNPILIGIVLALFVNILGIALQYKFRTERIGVAILYKTIAALVTVSILA